HVRKNVSDLYGWPSVATPELFNVLQLSPNNSWGGQLYYSGARPYRSSLEFISARPQSAHPLPLEYCRSVARSADGPCAEPSKYFWSVADDTARQANAWSGCRLQWPMSHSFSSIL